MTFWRNLGPQGQGIVAGLAVAAAAFLGFAVFNPPAAPPQVNDPPENAAPDPAPAVAPAPDSAPETGVKDASAPPAETAEPAPEETAAVPDQPIVEEPAPAPEQAAPPVDPPAFQLVRVSAEGAATVAGTAAPGAMVQVLVDGAEVAQARASGNGDFAALFDLVPSLSPRLMALGMQMPDGTVLLSDDVVILDPAPDRLAAVDPSPAPLPAETGQVAAQPTQPPEPETEAAPVGMETDPAAERPETGEEITENAPADDVPADAAPDPTPAPDTAPEVQPEPGEVPQIREMAVAESSSQARPETDAPQETPPPATQLAEAATDQSPDDSPAATPATPPAAATDNTPGDTAPQVATQAPDAPKAQAETRAPTVILATRDGVRVVQDATQPGPAQTPTAVSVDAITYRDDGAVAFSGRGLPGAFVRLYLNNATLITLPVDAAGSWSGTADGIAPGLYTLRADQLNSDGTVTARFETPFKRESADVLDGASEMKARMTASGVAVVTVQPGFTLWAIARENYGDGFQYVSVYNANKAQIRDPDLIYPGQVFRVPQPQQ